MLPGSAHGGATRGLDEGDTAMRGEGGQDQGSQEPPLEKPCFKRCRVFQEEPTQFAPAHRRPPDEIERHWDSLASTPLLGAVMSTVPDGMLVLNDCRQIVFANQAFASIAGRSDPRRLAGLRPGEAMGCVQAYAHPGGCGTSEFCRACGAVQAVLTCQAGRADVQECRAGLTSGDSLDIKVHATPLVLEGETLTMVCITDLSSEKRRRVLERIFFHDVLNTASGLHGLANLISHTLPPESDQGRLASTVCSLSKSIIEEIGAQKDLTAAEADDLPVQALRLQSLQALAEIAEAYRHHEVAHGKSILVDPESTSREFTSDRLILRRVLGNLLKNALEASPSGECVTVRCRTEGNEGVLFEVHNRTVMSRDVQLQVFRRSFSTKGPGRGVGTYSIKLLTEKYLGGEVDFDSDETRGTTFRVRLPASIPAQGGPSGESPIPAGVSGKAGDAPPPSNLEGARLLLAEDSRINQKIAVKILSSLGAKVQVASNGREVVELFQGQAVLPPFDIVLLDLQMPEMDGFEAAIALRSDPRLADLPIVALTADNGKQEIEHCLAAGMNAHIGKPYELDVMFETLRRFYRPAPS